MLKEPSLTIIIIKTVQSERKAPQKHKEEKQKMYCFPNRRIKAFILPWENKLS